MAPEPDAPGTTTWLVDGNNVYGSRPDGWWNDRARAAARLAQRVAEWCRDHDDRVVLVFDPPVPPEVLILAGGNLRIEAAPRRGRDAADDRLVTLATEAADREAAAAVVVVSSDKGLRQRLPPTVDTMGVGRFRTLIGY